MKRFLLFFVLTLNTFAFANTPLSNESLKRFDDYLTEITDAYHIPGMAFFITDKDHILMEKSFGQCTSLDQNFFIGSMSKSYTALCIMQLVEKGLINLDEDISVYLPEYKFKKKVTVLSLLNQTSGFNTHAKLHNVKVTKSYGKHEYANVNYDLLGKIIEKVSGMSYEDYIRQNVFEPLKMNNSIANAQKMKENSNLLQGNRNYFGFFKQGKADFPTEKSWFHEPAGYICTTPHDHAKYLQMYLSGGLSSDGTKIITPQGINSMWYKNVSIGQDDYDVYYGMGFNYMKYYGFDMIFHGGLVENTMTYMFILPEEGLAACFMVNANDYMVLNNLMDNAVWNSFAIIEGEEIDKVNHSEYKKQHLLYDAIYFLMFAVSVCIFISGFKVKKARNKIIAIVKFIAAYVLWPLLLLTFSLIFISTPLWVIKLYVPDLFLVIIISSVLAFCGGIIKLVKSKLQ